MIDQIQRKCWRGLGIAVHLLATPALLLGFPRPNVTFTRHLSVDLDRNRLCLCTAMHLIHTTKSNPSTILAVITLVTVINLWLVGYFLVLTFFPLCFGKILSFSDLWASVRREALL